MRVLADSGCIRVEADVDDRVAFLCEDYATLFDAPEQFKSLLSCLTGQHGHQLVGHWHALIDAGDKAALFRELIERHYDPAYRRSSHSLYRKLPSASPFVFRPNAKNMAAEAERLLAELGNAG
jgi:tRNA 2-selenouridine synthase